MTETFTVTVLSCEREESRDHSKHWWIVASTGGKFKVWDKPLADAIVSLAPLGPVEIDTRAASDPKYLPSITAARPSQHVAQQAAAEAAPFSNGDVELTVADAFRRASLAFKEIADALDPVPFQ